MAGVESDDSFLATIVEAEVPQEVAEHLVTSGWLGLRGLGIVVQPEVARSQDGVAVREIDGQGLAHRLTVWVMPAGWPATR